MQGSTRIDELRQKFHENPRRYFAPLANEYRKAGDPEQAIAICRAHLAQQPGHMSGHVVYGQALYDARRTEEARGVFEKALALDPDNAIVLRQLGDMAREKGEDTEARHWYARALEADPGDREVAAYIAELTEPVTAAEPQPQEVSAPVEPAVATGAIELVSHEAQVEEPVELEAEVPAPFHEPDLEPRPQMAPVPEEEAPAPAEDEVTWRKTPPHEDSPFVTRTMAELYAKQGYREAALDVYRQLALHHPDDKEIFDRIEALEKDAQAASAEPSPAEPEEAQSPPSSLAEHPRPTPTNFSFEPLISDVPSEPDEESAADITDRPAFAPSDEDLNLDTVSTGRGSPHFTELELSGGDAWDTDAWGAGFSSEDESVVELDSPDVPGEPAPAAPDQAPEPEAERQAEAKPEEEISETPSQEPAVASLFEQETREPENVEPETVEPETVELEPEPAVAEAQTPAWEEAAAAAEPEFAEARFSSTEELAPEPVAESEVVAYSPQLPADEDLPHFAPKGPTVREFFAALGAYRPPSRDGSSITAHAPSAEISSGADYPLATDAFASLFADAPVSEEDSRAAFALSGALGGTAPVIPTPSAPVAPVAARPEAPQAATSTQESEEDIRRFREWLDGLAES